MSIPSGTYTLESVQFPGVYLRMDGNGLTASTGPGGAGTVNCKYGAAGPWEKFRLCNDGCNYSIGSVQFPGVYLRMDGNGVTTPVGSGGGTVNCQYGVGPYEKFKFAYNGSDGSFSVESVQFPGVYLRMDGSGVTSGSGGNTGGGTVNCQFGAGPWEKFMLKSA